MSAMEASGKSERKLKIYWVFVLLDVEALLMFRGVLLI